MRVAIVNDLALAVEALRRVVAGTPGLEVAWTAADGAEAVRRCAEDRPDVVLMDLIMPVMDGVEATRRIMRDTPCAVLVVTATVEGNLDRVYDAMGCGALDAVATPVLGRDGSLAGGEALTRKIATVGRLVGREARPAAGAAAGPGGGTGHGAGLPPLLAIGCSTGGPHAVARLLAALPPAPPWATVVVQHVDEHFADGLARWLSEQVPVAVRRPVSGERPRAGGVYLAAGDEHLRLGPDGAFARSAEPRDTPHRPSVDAFFASAARHAPAGCAVLLTGMGRDGAEGMLALRRAGWHTIAQDEATSIVWGMPRAAVRLGAAVETLPLDAIAPRVAEICRAGAARRTSR